jgi:hypothetical protein
MLRIYCSGELFEARSPFFGSVRAALNRYDQMTRKKDLSPMAAYSRRFAWKMIELSAIRVPLSNDLNSLRPEDKPPHPKILNFFHIVKFIL